MAAASAPSRPPLRALGAATLGLLAFLGGVSLLVKEVLTHTFAGPFRGRPVSAKAFWTQAVRAGVRSIGIVALVNVFVGMILALIGGNILSTLGFVRYTGNLMSVGTVVELAPLLTGVIMTGYIGAALSAEIGTMVVSEEITALRTLALDPVRYIVAPRFLAVVLMVPCVTVIGMWLGILGGLVVATTVLDLSAQTYFVQAWEQLGATDVRRGVFKAMVFGGIIGSVGCYMGFQVKGGAEGVGRVTTMAVVYSIVFIIVTDAFLNYFLLFRL